MHLEKIIPAQLTETNAKRTYWTLKKKNIFGCWLNSLSHSQRKAFPTALDFSARALYARDSGVKYLSYSKGKKT